MKGSPLHAWTVDPEEAARIQLELRGRLTLAWEERAVRTIAGIDVSIPDAGRARAAIVILSYPALKPLEAATAVVPLTFPYIPGLLSFREGPAVAAAWERLGTDPDLLMFDGQGIAHPRGIGIAAHMGLWLGKPSIGVAKSRLYGRHAEPGPLRGDFADLRDPRAGDRIIGAVVRSKDNVKPLYVSPGDRIDVLHSIEFALSCCTRYRLPEPTRWAHRVAGGEQIG